MTSKEREGLLGNISCCDYDKSPPVYTLCVRVCLHVCMCVCVVVVVVIAERIPRRLTSTASASSTLGGLDGDKYNMKVQSLTRMQDSLCLPLVLEKVTGCNMTSPC